MGLDPPPGLAHAEPHGCSRDPAPMQQKGPGQGLNQAGGPPGKPFGDALHAPHDSPGPAFLAGPKKVSAGWSCGDSEQARGHPKRYDEDEAPGDRQGDRSLDAEKQASQPVPIYHGRESGGARQFSHGDSRSIPKEAVADEGIPVRLAQCRPVNTLQADTWRRFVEPGKVADARRMHRNLRAGSLCIWGQEMEIWRLACRRARPGAPELDWTGLRRIVDEDMALPLILPDYPQKIAAIWWAPKGDWWREGFETWR